MQLEEQNEDANSFQQDRSAADRQCSSMNAYYQSMGHKMANYGGSYKK